MTFEEFCITPRELLPPISTPVLSKDTKIKLDIITISFVLKDIYPVEVLAAVRLFGRNCIEVISDGHPFHLNKKGLDDISEITNQPGWTEYYEKNLVVLVEYRTTIRVFLNGTNIRNACGYSLASFFDPDSLEAGKTPTLLSDEAIMTRVILPRIYKEAYELTITKDSHISGVGMWKPHKVTDNPIASVSLPNTTAGCILYAGNGVMSVDFIKTEASEECKTSDFAVSGKDHTPTCKPAIRGKDYVVICAKLPLIDFIELCLCMSPEIEILDHDDISSIEAWGYHIFDGVDSLKRMYALPAEERITVLVKINMADVTWIDAVRKYNWAEAITPPLDALVSTLFKNKKKEME